MHFAENGKNFQLCTARASALHTRRGQCNVVAMIRFLFLCVQKVDLLHPVHFFAVRIALEHPLAFLSRAPNPIFAKNPGRFCKICSFGRFPGVARDHQWLGIMSGWLLSTRLQDDASLEERSPEPQAETCILRKMENLASCAPTARRHCKHAEDSAMLSP